jgi:hypothetical protein
MIETREVEYKKHWYKIVLWDNPQGDGLYHANIFKGNKYNTVHTTGAYLSYDDAVTASKAIIDFMVEQE